MQRHASPAGSVIELKRRSNPPASAPPSIPGAEGRVFVPGADLSWLGGPRVVSLEIHDFFAERFGMTVRLHCDVALMGL